MLTIAHLNVLEYGPLRGQERAKPVAIEQFAIYRSEETLAHCVRQAVSDRSSVGTDTSILVAQTEGEAGIPRFLNGMIDHVQGTTMPQGYIHGIQRHPGV